MLQHEKFKNRFRELVDAQGISKTNCAKQIGISYKTLKNIYEYGKSNRLRILIQIADFFNVSADYILGLSDDKTIKGTK